MTDWLHTDVTGWGLAGAMIVGFVISLARGWIVLRPIHRSLIAGAAAAEVKAVAAEQAKTEAEATKTGFYREAYGIERQRNDVIMQGLVTVVTEIRRAVADPERKPL